MIAESRSRSSRMSHGTRSLTAALFRVTSFDIRRDNPFRDARDLPFRGDTDTPGPTTRRGMKVVESRDERREHVLHEIFARVTRRPPNSADWSPPFSPPARATHFASRLILISHRR